MLVLWCGFSYELLVVSTAWPRDVQPMDFATLSRPHNLEMKRKGRKGRNMKFDMKFNMKLYMTELF